MLAFKMFWERAAAVAAQEALNLHTMLARQPCEVLRHAMCLNPSPGASAQSIMLALREGDDETAQLAALNELCELLAVSSEDALSMFPIDTLVPVLVRALLVGVVQNLLGTHRNSSHLQH